MYPGHVKPVYALLAVCLFAAPAAAQFSHGYAFIGGAFGGPDGFRYGLGGEGDVARRVTAGGEIGGFAGDFNGGVVSGNLSYHPVLRSRGNRVDPFITGGLSIVWARNNVEGYLNVGGGVNYWFQPRFGFRVEFRGYPPISGGSGFGEFRFGVSFR